MKINSTALIDAFKAIDAPIYKGDYNLNIFGIRSNDTASNAFNDVLGVLFQVAGKWNVLLFDGTTDPGIYYRENPINVDGTAILALGHHPGCWVLGAHKGKYPALVQKAPMRVHRDANQDKELDTDTTIDEGLFGINLHCASQSIVSMQVDKWSAGCQVTADHLDLNIVVALARKAASLYGNSFSYTLLSEEQLS
jgi:hypothetical protein